MKTDFYKLTSAGVVAHVAIRDDSTIEKSNLEVTDLAFEVAATQFITRGGYEDEYEVVSLLPSGMQIPDDAITHVEHPNVFVWFPK